MVSIEKIAIELTTMPNDKRLVKKKRSLTRLRDIINTSTTNPTPHKIDKKNNELPIRLNRATDVYTCDTTNSVAENISEVVSA